MKIIEELNNKFKKSKPEEVLEYFLNDVKNNVALSSSFGAEDQVLTHMMLKISKDANIFTLDTGRLPYETYNVMDETNLKYNIKVQVYFPKYENIEELYNTQGVNGFYESIENRKNCCYVRKIEPLRRALKNVDIWITGLRAEQSITRKELKIFEYDKANGIIKLNPLINFTEEQVWDYILKNSVPINKLHSQGYPSIGCAPCTRAIKEGEDIRSGRWWWENPEHKECGLHQK
ncbi:MAG: phosphoadenylyl-sulfate reductase [Arcobacteraceae bacterium]|nr:phosphoadenylyl-sulfate reductase [Arcobacteraceae bacterium]